MRRRMKFGDGRISGAFAVAFGMMSLAGVFCFLWPEYFTTPEFRSQYDVDMLRFALGACIFVAIACSLRSLVVSSKKVSGLCGGAAALVALALGGSGVEVGDVSSSPVYLSLDYLTLSLFAMALIFVPLELFFPKHREQTKFHPEWRTDFVYFIVAHLFVQVVGALSQSPAHVIFGGASLEVLHDRIDQIPYGLQVFLAVLVADLSQYGVHRLFHEVPFLWRFHSVHHSTRTMDWLAGSRLHLIDVVFTRMVVFLPLYALGFHNSVLMAYVAIVAVQAVLNHTNTRLPFRLLEWFIVSPRIHHWHHSVLERAHNKNYCVHFSWIDRIFGTYYAPKDEWPSEVGLEGVSFPKGYLKQFIYPFFYDPSDGAPGSDASTR